LKSDLATFEDLCKVDYLAFWKLYESEFCELSASDIVELNNDLQISLILRFYMQALINKAFKLVAPERLGELVFIKNQQFDKTDAINTVIKFLDDASSDSENSGQFQALSTIKDKINSLQLVLTKKE